MTPFIAEIIGTAILILLGNGVVANVLLDDTKGHDSGLIVISMAWGLAVYCGVIVAGPISWRIRLGRCTPLHYRSVHGSSAGEYLGLVELQRPL